MTGKNLGICFFVLFAFCIAATGCSNVGANKRTNPVGSEVNGENTVSTGTSSTSNGVTKGADPSFLPVVNLSASSNRVGANTEVVLKAEAIDPAGAPVALAWDSSGGMITSIMGSSAVWQAPSQSSKAIISCTATDVRGGKGKAEVEIEVIGNSTYKLNILVDRSSLSATPSYDNPQDPYVPVAGARVILKAFNFVGITDKKGNVEFAINQADKVATYSDIEVSYRDWNLSYNAKLVGISGSVVNDSLIFSPGYNNVSIAQGSGDSFDLKRGSLEVSTTEKNSIGILQPLSEVAVNCSVGQAISDRETGIATILSCNSNSETNLNLSKNGYGTVEGCIVPLSQTTATLVSVEMVRNGTFYDNEPSISWIKPYNYKTAVSVMNPFIIGFSQNMEKDSVFDSIDLMVQNKTKSKLIPMSGNEIKDFFNIEWKSGSIVYLYPKKGYEANSRYSILINNWNAKSIEGRFLKSYIGTYYEFETDEDPSPRIVSYTPVNGETGVNRSGPFTISFDRSIAPDSIYENTEFQMIAMDSGLTYNITGSSIRSFFSLVWKNNDTQLQLVPNRTLEPWATYQIRIKKCSFRSASGKAISGLENSWIQFNTGGI